MRLRAYHLPRLSLALATLGCALALTACGSSSSKHAGSSGDSQLALSQCMRAHGVPNYPDPTKGPGGEGFHISQPLGGTSGTLTVDGTPFSGPVFEAAEKTCKLFGGGTSPPAVSESQKLALFHFSECMRAHGVPNYADPSFPAGGGIERPVVPGLSEDSPVVRKAAAVCNRS
ncbi:MAG TPA: hypothetical protein VIJ20_10040 [Solirubrobacteraceae bacterium]